MATITGLTAERMLEIEANSVVDGAVVGDDLFLTKQDGTPINAGNVRGPQGNVGPPGAASFPVVTAKNLLEVGIVDQIRVGRQFTVADFTNLGLDIPAALWNLGTNVDASGNGRTLTVKGGLSVSAGINAVPNTASYFVGSTAQGLYSLDTGAADPLRIRTGTWGCWFRTAKRGVGQYLISKLSSAAGNFSWGLLINASNNLSPIVSNDGTATYQPAPGITDVCDDRWHFAVVTSDGLNIRLYTDGVLEATGAYGNLIFAGNGPLNIGSQGADASTSASNPAYGRIDEAFVTPEILSEDQIHNLYCASIPHALGEVPSSVFINVRRRRRGERLAVTDFPAQPVRLHNFADGVLTDQGSNNTPIAVQGGLSLSAVAGPDGKKKDAYHFPGIGGYYLISSDTGLPSGLSSRSWGLWFKATSVSALGLMQWGATAANSLTAAFIQNTGVIYLRRSSDGASDIVTSQVVTDGEWHFMVVVEDNTAADGLKRKVYVDGRLVGSDTTMATIALAGASGFTVGHAVGVIHSGQLARPFVYAGALTVEQVLNLYNKSGQELAISPKVAGDHIDAIEEARLLADFTKLEGCDALDLVVAP